MRMHSRLLCLCTCKHIPICIKGLWCHTFKTPTHLTPAMCASQAREAELSACLAAAHSSLATMQRLHTATQNQLFEVQSRGEEESAGRQAEMELARYVSV